MIIIIIQRARLVRFRCAIRRNTHTRARVFVRDRASRNSGDNKLLYEPSPYVVMIGYAYACINYTLRCNVRGCSILKPPIEHLWCATRWQVRYNNNNDRINIIRRTRFIYLPGDASAELRQTQK